MFQNAQCLIVSAPFSIISASTILVPVPLFQAEMIDPALKGTLNVLSSCAKTPTVKRVVVTSSIAAVVYTGKPRTPEVVVDETWFSIPDICKELKVHIYVMILPLYLVGLNVGRKKRL